MNTPFIDDIDFFAKTFEERKSMVGSRIGIVLWKIRKANGLTQHTVVANTFITRRFLTYVENGRGGSLELMLRLFYYYDKFCFIPCFLREEFEALLTAVWNRGYY
ncbi:hypothetical protein [Bacteroides sp. 224]|uniref:hypothetical protein n=1 Tax=Bacteroides sp. 224 TaxID=2302936 RepID=UPI0013D6B735|nr:hypothetical protein [Bacteroides sp. 224]NDV66427.1 hypothetical protein [Bacteroides sp. 224]